MGGSETYEARFRVTAEDDTGPVFDELGDKAAKTGEKVSGVFSKDTSKNLAHFNETGSKAAYLLSSMGGVAGQAGAAVTRFGGVVSSLAGKATILELGILAAGVAVVALGAKLYELANEGLVRTKKAIDDTVESIQKMREEAQKTDLAKALEGLSDLERRRLEYRSKLTELDIELINRDAELIALAVNMAEWTGREARENLEILRAKDETYQKALQASALLKSDVADTERLLALERDRAKGLFDVYGGAAARTIAAGATSGAGGVTGKRSAKKAAKEEASSGPKLRDMLEGGGGTSAADTIRANNEAIEAEEARHQKWLDDINAQFAEAREQRAEELFEREIELRQKWADEDKRIEEERIRQSEEAKRRQAEMVEQAAGIATAVTGIYEKIATSTAKSEKERVKHQAIAAAVYSAIQMVVEIAKAAASFASQDYLGGALHIAAAASFGVAAAFANRQSGGAGAGAASVSAPPSASDHEYWEKRKEEQGGSVTNFYVDGDVISGDDLGDWMSNEIEKANRRRRPGQTQASLRV